MDSEITSVSYGITKEPDSSHLNADQKLHEEEGMRGKSLNNYLAGREQGIYGEQTIVKTVERKNDEETETLGLLDFLPPAMKDHFDEDGYLNDPEDPFWGRTSCHQTSAVIGGLSVEDIKKYEEEKKGTVQLIIDKTEQVGSVSKRSGDIILFKRDGRFTAHSCNFVGTTTDGVDIVISRDGRGPAVPIRLNTLKNVFDDYSRSNPNIQFEYRRKRL